MKTSPVQHGPTVPSSISLPQGRGSHYHIRTEFPGPIGQSRLCLTRGWLGGRRIRNNRLYRDLRLEIQRLPDSSGHWWMRLLVPSGNGME